MTHYSCFPWGGRWVIRVQTRSGRIYHCDSATEPTPEEMREAWRDKRRFFTHID